MNFKEDFKKVIEENKIVLFMKGTKEMPVCGFSKTVVSVLDHYGVDFHDVNILGHEDMRPALADGQLSHNYLLMENCLAVVILL